MSPSLRKILAGIYARTSAGEIRLTAKASRELAALGAGLDPEDVREVLLGLIARDFVGRHASRTTREWMYVFKPQIGSETAYLKLILRDECVIVSFHEDEGGGDEKHEGSN